MDKHVDDQGKVRYGHEAREQKNVYDTRAAYGSAAQGYVNFLEKPGNFEGAATILVGIFATIPIGLMNSYNLTLNLNRIGIPAIICAIVLGVAQKFIAMVNRTLSIMILFFVSIVAMVGFVLVFFTGTGPMAKDFKTVQATITANELYLYQEPSSRGAAVDRSARSGIDKARVYGVTADGWALISWGSDIKFGWVKSDSLSFETNKQPRAIKTGRVITNQLSVHSYSRQHSKVENDPYKPPKKNGLVAILGDERDGFLPLIYINYEGMLPSSVEGYALAKHIFIDGGTKQDAPQAPAGQTGTIIKGTNVPLRSTRSMRQKTANMLRVMIEGEKVVVLAKIDEKGWYRAWYDGQEGYIGSYNLKVE